ncbi:grasp-with-spasm system ATP-grasp peptide maturase [Taibaiella chishuiensis]|uniref:ATP-GRASP peptide maturase of grasp-with-spasm system n=1 Tax=Taibaiella chishuiensis TaxID=1434707 RepID=A0A2P8DAI7_9BACT|nr:grasp-with-spasm system ATP-grasp peptide maturase [Taibaiella chishuiensis]PSK94191.1 ATP-GRASP peptide maturase of grasp-with-spasm system [Taibaiella chishuiensis]
MILIVSDHTDTSTSVVINWIESKGKAWIRLNDFDFESNGVDFIYSDSSSSSQGLFSLVINGQEINSNQIRKIWYRRFFASVAINITSANEERAAMKAKVEGFVVNEKHSLKNVLANTVPDESKWLNRPVNSNINKIDQLVAAKKLGFDIPGHMITNNKKHLISFKQKCGKIIVKPLYNIRSISIRHKTYVPFTSLISETFIEKLGEHFFPSFFQEYIEKQYEIRTFYLNGICYSMAMFSQRNDKTTIDFRNYDNNRPNRRVPYKLPSDIEVRIDTFMKAMGLNSGSLDFIYATNGKYYFLEVNPVGQFGMVSYPCNYYLEEKISNFLMHE